MGCKKTSLDKSLEKFGDKFSYEGFTNETKPNDLVTIICPKHGYHTNKAKEHYLSMFGCKSCALDSKVGAGLDKRREAFLKKASEVHERGHYDLSKTAYLKSNSKVEIYCNLCKKIFKIKANHFVRGHGCAICGKKKASRQLTGFYNEKLIERERAFHLRTRNNVYLMKVLVDGEYKYKIGIAKDIYNRRHTLGMYLQEVQEVASKSLSTYNAFYVEQFLQGMFKEFNYDSETIFAGHTELYDLKEDHIKFVINFLEDIKEACIDT